MKLFKSILFSWLLITILLISFLAVSSLEVNGAPDHKSIDLDHDKISSLPLSIYNRHVFDELSQESVFCFNFDPVPMGS